MKTAFIYCSFFYGHLPPTVPYLFFFTFQFYRYVSSRMSVFSRFCPRFSLVCWFRYLRLFFPVRLGFRSLFRASCRSFMAPFLGGFFFDLWKGRYCRKNKKLNSKYQFKQTQHYSFTLSLRFAELLFIQRRYYIIRLQKF